MIFLVIDVGPSLVKSELIPNLVCLQSALVSRGIEEITLITYSDVVNTVIIPSNSIADMAIDLTPGKGSNIIAAYQTMVGMWKGDEIVMNYITTLGSGYIGGTSTTISIITGLIRTIEHKPQALHLWCRDDDPQIVESLNTLIKNIETMIQAFLHGNSTLTEYQELLGSQA